MLMLASPEEVSNLLLAWRQTSTDTKSEVHAPIAAATSAAAA
jgi:hypothetical protein